MHLSLIQNLKSFFNTYYKYFNKPTVLELGSLTIGVKGRQQSNIYSIKKELGLDFKYIGVDTKKGSNVDIV